MTRIYLIAAVRCIKLGYHAECRSMLSLALHHANKNNDKRLAGHVLRVMNYARLIQSKQG